MVKLTDKKIKWAFEQVINKGESTELVAAIYGVSHVCSVKYLWPTKPKEKTYKKYFMGHYLC
jgi:hypothetical protein